MSKNDSSDNIGDKKKGANGLAVLAQALFKLIGLMFISFHLWKRVSDLKHISRLPIGDEGWTSRQISKLNRAAVLLLLVPLVCLPLSIASFKNIKTYKDTVYISETNRFVAKLSEKYKWIDNLDTVLSEKIYAVKTKPHAKVFALMSFLFLILPILVGVFVKDELRINVLSDRLRRHLEAEGIFKKGDKVDEARICIATEAGYYIDITGHTPKSIAERETLWKRLNVVVDEKNIIEDPEDPTRVYLKNKFILKDTYDFNRAS